MTAIYLTRDLLFSSRVISAAAACGLEMTVVATGDQLLTALDGRPAHFVLLDFSTPGLSLLELVPRIRAKAPATIVAFGPHVDTAGIAAAKQAGCDAVYTRGQFHNQMADILRRHGCTA